MKTFITQPTYLPWIGIFKAIDYCDNFVFYNDVQFEKQSWQQRNRILNTNIVGKEFIYLAIQTKKHKIGALVKNIEIKNDTFYLNHLEIIRNIYRKSPFYDPMISLLEKVYSKKYKKTADLNEALIKELCNFIGIHTIFHHSDKLHITGGKNQRLINICKKLNTKTYLSPVGSKSYLDVDLFNDNNIKIEFLNFEHPVYKQPKDNFISHLSIIDILMSIGAEQTKKIIQNIQLKQ